MKFTFDEINYKVYIKKIWNPVILKSFEILIIHEIWYKNVLEILLFLFYS